MNNLSGYMYKFMIKHKKTTFNIFKYGLQYENMLKIFKSNKKYNIY